MILQARITEASLDALLIRVWAEKAARLGLDLRVIRQRSGHREGRYFATIDFVEDIHYG